MNDEQKARNASPTAGILRQAIATLARGYADYRVDRYCDPAVEPSAKDGWVLREVQIDALAAFLLFVRDGRDPVDLLRDCDPDHAEYAARRFSLADDIERSIKEGAAPLDTEAKWAAKVEAVHKLRDDAEDEVWDGLDSALRILEAQ